MKDFLRSILEFLKAAALGVPHVLTAFIRAGRGFLTHFYIHINSFARKILATLYTVKFRYIVMVYTANFLIGRILALQGDFAGSLIHQIDLTIISFIGLYMMQFMHRVVKGMSEAMAGHCPEISVCLERFHRAKIAPITLLLPIFPVVYVTKMSIGMSFVPLSVLGYYEIFFYAAAFYLSIICYWLLLLSAKTIYEMTKIECANLPFTYPNDLWELPGWLKSMADIYRKAQFAFFTVGMLFTVEFIILMPDGIEIVDANGVINKALPPEFWSAWIIIFVFIIIGFPAFWLVLRKLIVRLTLNFNQRALAELTFINNAGPADLTSVWSYYQLINYAVRFEKKIFPKHNYYPLVTTTVSFILNLYKVWELIKAPLFAGNLGMLCYAFLQGVV